MRRVFREMSLDKWDWSPSPLPGQVVLVTSQDADGNVDVAPKSWITVVGMTGPRIGFGCTLEHQTARNVQATGEFAINIPDAQFAEVIWRMPETSDRLTMSGLSVMPATVIGVPLISECFAHLECRLDQSVALAGEEVFIIGVVLRMDIDARAISPATVAERYATISPFFFLEPGWHAELGAARPVSQ